MRAATREITLANSSLDDLTTATYDRIAPEFAERTWSTDLADQRARFANSVTGPASPGRFRLLDAGCGPGRDALWFAERGFQVVGADRSAGMLAEARRRGVDVSFVQADLRQLPFAAGEFDGIWCCASLLHVSRAEAPAVLGSFNRLLGHGWLWLTVKQGTGEEIEERGYGRGNPRRFTYFSRPELELSLERANFEVRAVDERTPTTPSAHSWLSILAQTRIVPPLLGAAAIIFDAEGRVLMSERADGRGWNLPAGFVDHDEGSDETAVRETLEETGLIVVVERLVAISTATYRYHGSHGVLGQQDRKLMSHAYLCRVVGGRLVPTNESIQHGWFPPDALPAPIASQRHLDFLRDALAFRAGRLSWPAMHHYE